MSRLVAEVTYNETGQTVETRVSERPASATFKVLAYETPDDGTVKFQGAATIEAVNTTVASTSGVGQADPNRINLTSTAGIQTSRKYTVSEGGKQEVVSPVQVETGYIRVRYPLRNSYTTAATFVGTTLVAAIDATFVADLANISLHEDVDPGYRVLWAYVVSGVEKKTYSYFDLIRAPITHQVDLDDVNARAPGLYSSMPTEYKVEQGRPLIDAAWRSVRAKMQSLSIDVDALRNDEVLDELVILKCLNLLARGGWRPPAFDSQTEYVAMTQSDFDRFVEQHYQVTLSQKLATGTGGDAETVKPKDYWAR